MEFASAAGVHEGGVGGRGEGGGGTTCRKVASGDGVPPMIEMAQQSLPARVLAKKLWRQWYITDWLYVIVSMIIRNGRPDIESFVQIRP